MNGSTKEFDQLDFESAQKFIKEKQFNRAKPKKAKDLLAKLMTRKGLGQQQANEALQIAWKQAVGERRAESSQPGYVKRGVLEVFVESSIQLQQLEFEKKKLISELQNLLPQNNIKNIRFKIGKIIKDG
jgi:predicted nucleic acid-binding Zn ribbon protein